MINILVLIGICMAMVGVFIFIGAIAWEMYTNRDMEKTCNFGITIVLFSIPFLAAYPIVAFLKLFC